MNINEVLHDIQQKLKAPKNQYNKFGGYNYRSCEDILEAVKPLLPAGVVITLNDGLQDLGGRVFVVAQASLSFDNISTISSCGCAEVAKEQKGMQPAQITGSASSYARKYALNGLFCIDDTKDNDTEANKNESEGRAKQNTVKPQAIKPEPTQAQIEAQAFVKSIKTDIENCTTSKDVMEVLKSNFDTIAKTCSDAQNDYINKLVADKKKQLEQAQ